MRNRYVSDERKGSVMANRSGQLTPREQEVVALLCDGLADKEVAAKLGIGCVTVRTYVARACEKLGAANRTQLGRSAPPIGDSAAGGQSGN